MKLLELITIYPFTGFLISISYVRSLDIADVPHDDVHELKKHVEENILDLMNKQFGWNHGETHQAVVALALGRDTFFKKNDMLNVVITKQLKLELSEALIKWHKKPLSVGQLAMFINALISTHNNPYDFFNVNLVSRLQHMTPSSDYERSLYFLTLCVVGYPLPKDAIMQLIEILNDTDSTHGLDAQAMALIAISCKIEHFQKTYVQPVVNDLLFSFKSKQKDDGSFGNIYTSALVVQALIAAGDAGNNVDDVSWFRHALNYFKQQYEDSNELDFLSHCLVLPILNFKSMVYLKTIYNSEILQKLIQENELWAISLGEDNEDAYYGRTSSIESEHNMTAVSYTLRHQDQNGYNVSFSTVVFIRDGETLLDVMEKASVADAKFHFVAKQFNFGLMIESLAGLHNDDAASLYWFIYSIESSEMEPKRIQIGVTSIKPKDGDHFLLWYHKM